MKITKHQNTSTLPILQQGQGFTWTPEGLKAEELATRDDLSPEMQDLIDRTNKNISEREKQEYYKRTGRDQYGRLTGEQPLESEDWLVASTLLPAITIDNLVIPYASKAVQQIGIKAAPTIRQKLIQSHILGADGKLFNSLIPEKKENFYRVVRKDAIDDAKTVGLIRGNPRTGDGPYFQNTQNPQGRKIRASVNERSVQDRYVIEGTPESAESWIDSWRASSRRQHIKDQHDLTHNILPEYHSDSERAFWKELRETQIKDIRQPIIENPKAIPYLQEHGSTMMEFGTEAFPMTNGKFEAPAKNFVYYKHFPVFGWRQFHFKQGGTLKAQPGTKLLTPHKDYLGTPYKQDGDYDYFNAHPTNQPSQPGEHWSSRNPITGQLLKSENHPTFDLMMGGEKEANMEIYRGLDGKLYSYPKEQMVPYYLKHFNYEPNK